MCPPTALRALVYQEDPMNKTLLERSSVVAKLALAAALVAACNQNKGKEVTKEQEDRLNRIDTLEKKNKSDAEKLTQQLKDVSDREKKISSLETSLETKREELEKIEKKISATHGALAASGDNLQDERTKLEGMRTEVAASITDLEQKRLEAKNEFDRQQSELGAERTNLEREKKEFEAMLASFSSVVVVPEESYLSDEFSKLSPGQSLPIVFVVSAPSVDIRETLKLKIMTSSVPGLKMHQKEVNSVNSATYIVGMNSPEQIKSVVEEKNKFENVKLIYYPMMNVKIRTKLNLIYRASSHVVEGLSNTQPIYVGEKFESASYLDPIASGALPKECENGIYYSCLEKLKPTLESRNILINNNLVSLKNLLVAELERTAKKVLGIVNVTTPNLFAYDASKNNRVLVKISITSELLVVGPKKSDPISKEMQTELKDPFNVNDFDQLLIDADLKAYESTDFSKIVSTAEMANNLRILAEALK